MIYLNLIFVHLVGPFLKKLKTASPFATQLLKKNYPFLIVLVWHHSNFCIMTAASYCYFSHYAFLSLITLIFMSFTMLFLDVNLLVLILLLVYNSCWNCGLPSFPFLRKTLGHHVFKYYVYPFLCHISPLFTFHTLFPSLSLSQYILYQPICQFNNPHFICV